jgi:hypothetical protein
MCLALMGCAQTISWPDRNKIPVVHYRGYPLSVNDTSQASNSPVTGGLVGALAAAVITEVIAQNRSEPRLHGQILTEDPAIRVKATFLSRIPQNLALQNIDEPQYDIPVVGDLTVEEQFRSLKQRFGAVRLLDFRTMEFNARTDRIMGGTPVFQYSVRARLIDLDRTTVEWEAICRMPKDRERPGSERELAVDNWKLLRDTFNAVADFCAAQLLEDFLKNGTPQQP